MADELDIGEASSPEEATGVQDGASLPPAAAFEAGRDLNAQTVVFRAERTFGTPDFRGAFLRCYRELRSLCEGVRTPSIALAAIDRRGLAATAMVEVHPDRANSAIIGRHVMADLCLEEDPALSLRHLAVLVFPHAGDDIRFRIVDLRSGLAFIDEQGRKLEALEAEGSVFIGCGGYVIVAIVLDGHGELWPDDPHHGWECIPERVYLDEAPCDPHRWRQRRLRAGWKRRPASDVGSQEAPRRRTLVQSVRGPVRARRQLLRSGESKLGELHITSSERSSTIIIGSAAAREGVLVGRYERCDNEGLPVLINGRISRVHLLLVQLGGVLYAVDTASTNGVWIGREEMRLVELRDGLQLCFGDNLATLRWSVDQAVARRSVSELAASDSRP